MRDWFQLVDTVLRPARPHLARCLDAREAHVAARRDASERTGQAIKECERQIVALREVVFAANDGFVGARMTDLERTWRRLSRVDPDAGLMELWARIAPAPWLDQKRWRGSPPEAQLEAAVLLAADVDGVEAAEAAVRSLRAGSKIAWSLHPDGAAKDADYTDLLLAEPEGAPVPPDLHPAIVERARRVEAEVREAVQRRFADRACLAHGIGRAAFADHVWHAVHASRNASERPANPAAALFALWKTGYVIASIEPSCITLEIPPRAA